MATDEIELDVDETCLSEIDGSVPSLKSVVVRVTNEDNGKRSVTTNEAVASSVCDSTPVSSTDLFPNPPSRVPSKPQRLVEIDLFARKKSCRSKHPSNYKTLSSGKRVELSSKPLANKGKSLVPVKPLHDVIQKVKDASRQKHSVAYVPTEEEKRFSVKQKQTPVKQRIAHNSAQNHQSTATPSPVVTKTKPLGDFKIPRKPSQPPPLSKGASKLPTYEQLLVLHQKKLEKTRRKNRNRRLRIKRDRELLNSFLLNEI